MRTRTVKLVSVSDYSLPLTVKSNLLKSIRLCTFGSCRSCMEQAYGFDMDAGILIFVAIRIGEI